MSPPPRIHATHLHPGPMTLPAHQAHHIRDVLRLTVGDSLALFDDSGSTATARLTSITAHQIQLDVGPISPASAEAHPLTVAAALPKGPRADWMVEKLAELGVARLIPLAATRSVTLHAGDSKTSRWHRLAIEAAQQSGRNTVMTIDPLTSPADLPPDPATWLLSTEPRSTPAAQALSKSPLPNRLLIGPEGGWTPAELASFDQPNIVRVRLTPTVLRIETAAVVVAGLILIHAASISANQK